ncbi:MAG: holo-ACP synthase [Planctomycetes bacterium]|nr:holo-ACP synthase [Planctomycetota bacterium]
MMVGVGVDLVQTARFAGASERLLNRLFTAQERDDASRQRRPELHWAARFAAKEAVLKALGTGWSGGIAWTDVEVRREPGGSVRVRLSGTARAAARRRRIRRWHLSLTHTLDHAMAVAIAER